MPFADAAFDCVVCQAAFKNFPEPVAALDEIHRVLRPGGSASIFDLRKDAPAAAIEAEIRRMRLSPPNALLTRAVFRWGLLRAAYTPHTRESLVTRSHFGRGDLVLDGIGFELRLHKQPSGAGGMA